MMYYWINDIDKCTITGRVSAVSKCPEEDELYIYHEGSPCDEDSKLDIKLVKGECVTVSDIFNTQYFKIDEIRCGLVGGSEGINISLLIIFVIFFVKFVFI